MTRFPNNSVISILTRSFSDMKNKSGAVLTVGEPHSFDDVIKSLGFDVITNITTTQSLFEEHKKYNLIIVWNFLRHIKTKKEMHTVLSKLNYLLTPNGKIIANIEAESQQSLYNHLIFNGRFSQRQAVRLIQGCGFRIFSVEKFHFKVLINNQNDGVSEENFWIVDANKITVLAKKIFSLLTQTNIKSV